MQKNVKISVERSGGFIGVPKKVIVNLQSLSSDDQDMLLNAIEKSRFFDLPLNTPLPTKGADYFKYKITIEENGKSHTINTNDITMTLELRPLVNFAMSMKKI